MDGYIPASLTGTGEPVRHYLLMASWTNEYWEKIREAILEHRKRSGAKRALSEYEYLYNELNNYLEQHPELKAK